MSGGVFEDDMLSLQMSERKRTVVGKTVVTRTRTDLISLLYIIPNRENRNSTPRFISIALSLPHQRGVPATNTFISTRSPVRLGTACRALVKLELRTRRTQ
jgi:hypothetical protein